MPNVRRRRVDCRFAWVCCHWERRASRGCVEEICEADEECVCWERRRVSGRPGAEGAPRETEEEVEESLEDWVLVVVDGWAAGGAMRRD